MNNILKNSIANLGYNFIPKQFLPKGKDESYLRNIQNGKKNYRSLTAKEIKILEANRNISDNWEKVLVSGKFAPELIKNCKFYGLVRIGNLEPYYLEFSNLRMSVGLYNSTIISCDFGDNVVIDNVNYISHYIIGNDVMIINVNELSTTDHAKFGNGIIKEGELEKSRIWLEICNENAGRSIIPFDGMLPGDAWLASRFRDNNIFQKRLIEFTEKKFDNKRGYFGTIGDRTVIKNTGIIKDVKIGSDAYIKGANKLKNLTINSSPQAKTQIGEGCELVNGIIDIGCRIFYGVKAVRFIMASNSQLKYGARLINSYLGNNSTISCCEVLNSLIFPAHEQHHNNSFLCAALIMGQSNIAAGATLGSNHNSRSPDGELMAGRGFWPGLCVSLKHNSKFASYTILAKGDYPAELNIPIPFSLVINDVSKDQLSIMPGYWFTYNMYALSRNAGKYIDRDKRIEKTQYIEYDFLAPDTVNEIIHSLQLFKKLTGRAYYKHISGKNSQTEKDLILTGEKLLENNDPILKELEILADDMENSKRKVVLLKIPAAYNLFKELIQYYTATQLVSYLSGNKSKNIKELLSQPVSPGEMWCNVGGQLVPEKDLAAFIKKISSGKIKSWEEVHHFYAEQGKAYSYKKLLHSFAALKEVFGTNWGKDGITTLRNLVKQSITTKEWMVQNIRNSRAKDYTNPFRKMMYDTQKEMDAVLGKLDDNTFIKQEMVSLLQYKKTAGVVERQLAQSSIVKKA